MSSRNGWRRRASALGLCIGVFGALATACSLLVNTNANQCSVDGDCASFGREYKCSSQKLCVGPDAGSDGPMNDVATTESGTGDGAAEMGAGCTSNSECGAWSVCVQSACVSLKSSQCSSVLGAADSSGAIADGSLVFGAILPTPPATVPNYLASLGDMAKSMTAGLSLAVTEFATVGGLPSAVQGSTTRRPLVFVTCADNHTVADTYAATQHLVSDLGVPAIIGSGYSTFTNAIAAEIATLKSNTALLAPRSTGSGPSTGSMNTWHIALPDNSEAVALISLANYVASQLDGGTASVSIAYKGDEYGTNVATTVGKVLTAATMHSYGNSDGAMYVPSFAGVQATIVAEAPRIIVLVGTDEAVGSVLQAIETSWPMAAPRPSYVLSSGMLTPGLWKALAAGDPTSVRTRILGVAGGASTMALMAPFGTYQTALESPSSGVFAITSGAAEAYDAVYMLAYSAVAIGTMPITGPSLEMGFQQLSGIGGSPMPTVGKMYIGSTFQQLSGGQPIALQGASGPLSIKGQGRSLELAQIWCIPAPAGAEAIFSGAYVDANGLVQGTLSSACN
jgi:ABC-type branched-subunit amino acid transport system substrate-binding protein